MICIAYLSTAVHPPAPEELSVILASSQRNNADHGVTGLLCHHDGSFLQFLEGEEAAVEAVYARIEADRRHHSLLRLYKRPIAQRLFPEWSMAVVTPDEVGPEHGPFCRGLRDLDETGADDYASAVAPFLNSFRSWLR